MRARQFIIEYDRTKTAQAYTAKLVNQALKDPTVPGAVRNNINNTLTPLEGAELILKNQIELGDPTKNKKYAQTLARMYANGLIKWEDVGSTMRDYLTKFTQLGIKKMLKSEHSDFNRFKDLKSFYDAVDSYPDIEEQPEVKEKGQSQEVYKDANVRVIRPDNEQAACYYGQGTRWCTAAKNDNMFARYHNEGPMYIMLPTKPKYEGEKYQIHPDSGQYMNEGDYPVEAQDLIDRFGEGFREWLLKADPVLMEMVRYYTNDQELESAWRAVGELVNEKAYEVIFDWEVSDDYYYSWLKDNGHVDDDGIKDDAPPYDEYNEEAGAWLHRMTEIPNMTADEIREITQQLSESDNKDYYLRDLDEVYSYAIEIAQDRHETAGLEVWVYKNVDVKYYPDKDEITVNQVDRRFTDLTSRSGG